MADETPETEETTDAAPEATTDAAPEAVVDETPAAEEAAAEEAPADEPAAEEPVAEEPAAPAEPPAPVEHPKVVRGRERSTHTGETRGPRSIEERTAERKAARRAKAVARTRRRGQEREKARALRAENPGVPTPPREHGPGAPKTRLGIVVSDKADKTITVQIDSARQHRRYKKIVRRTNTLHAHDESNSAHVGDRVQLIESRPLSATKRWRLVEILERAK
jgi:small subunit ribosomal protein S17